MKVRSVKKALALASRLQFPVIIQAIAKNGAKGAFWVDTPIQFEVAIKIIFETFTEVKIGNMVRRSDVDKLIETIKASNNQ